MRIKAPELNVRQNQLARIIFIFFVLNILLFLVITDGIGAVSLQLKDPLSVTDIILIKEPRIFVILGTTIVVFFYFARFGHLYLQSVKEVANTHGVIDAILPHGRYNTAEIREALLQTCRSNYIVQTLVVFLFKDTVNDDNEFTLGPLSGSSRARGMFIKCVMILTSIAVEWIIVISQFIIIVVFLAVVNWFFSLLLFLAFVLYYGFYFEYVVKNWLKVREAWALSLTIVTGVLIGISVTANALVLVNYDKSPNVFSCRMSYEKIYEISPPAAIAVSFLFKDRAAEQPTTGWDVPLCPLGRAGRDVVPARSALPVATSSGIV